jgi:Xaa-Pro aminopeptidase
MLQDRISIARSYLERGNVEAIIFVNLANIRYLAGFTGSDGILVLAADKGWFLTDSRYVTQAASEVPSFTIVEYRGKIEGVVALFKEQGFRRIGFEADHMTVAFHGELASALQGTTLCPLERELDTLRIVKDQQELDLLANTAAVASSALIDNLELIRPGTVEQDLALALEFAMKKRGAEEKSFDFIVASGWRGALPHGKASDKVIEAGELVTIDFGAVKKGYHSDETVTIGVGSLSSRQQEIYQIVKDAHDMALEAIRPGVAFKDLDAIARNHIDSKGYGRYFGHGLGHGVGLDVHEKPLVSSRGEGVVEAGMVFTIEPGVYIPEWGGVRIEDTVAATSDGYRLLTKVPKELMIV